MYYNKRRLSFRLCISCAQTVQQLTFALLLFSVGRSKWPMKTYRRHTWWLVMVLWHLIKPRSSGILANVAVGLLKNAILSKICTICCMFLANVWMQQCLLHVYQEQFAQWSIFHSQSILPLGFKLRWLSVKSMPASFTSSRAALYCNWEILATSTARYTATVTYRKSEEAA